MTLLTTRRKNGEMPTLLNTDFFGNESLWSDLFNDQFFNSGMENKLPSVNVIENTNEFMIEVAAPGLKKDDFKVEVEGDLLTISSEKEVQNEEEKENYRRKEFSYNYFSRSFRLPENLVTENIDAKYENGILRLALPKKEVTLVKPKKEIKVS